MTEVIHISVDAEGIATLLFDRSDSAMNTMDMKFMDEMEAAVERLATDGPTPRTATIAATNVFVRGADGWRMVLHHASPVPEISGPEDSTPRVLH